MIIDIALYKYWGIRIDYTLLNYMDTPELMFATVSTSQIIIGPLVWILYSLFQVFIFNKIVGKKINSLQKGKLIEAPVFLVIVAALILPIRGGFQEIPINQSNVYFSNTMFANQASVNFIWNFSHSFTYTIDSENPNKRFDDQVAQDIIDKNRNPLLKRTTDSILTVEKPNVIFIIWESLSAKFVGALGGEKDITSNLNALSKEGILFTNFYANGDRTDKGIPAILSGYYPQTTASIIKLPNKSRTLPIITSHMTGEGYHTSFYYGGDLNFGNMNTYLRNGGVSKFVDGSEFDEKDWSSKWGAFDHVFMERLSKDLSGEQQEPFFTIALTLSSHEPFDVPTYKFGKDSETNMFRSAHAYTDETIGKFIKNAKKQPWWDNTLIVILADHGHAIPKHEGVYNSPLKFKIPMLWLGGAIKNKGTTVSTIGGQTDLTYTLASVLGHNPEKFTFGKNLFIDSETQYAHFIYNNGFGTVDKNGYIVYDYVGDRIIEKKGTSAQRLDSLGKALTQNAYQDFIDRK
ncbi:MAG: LTA synthase family protein [Flavobacteriaceae bacterium]